MSIRLSKIAKELNVGINSLVEFLHKKGFSDIEANPNVKIEEEQYNLLLKEYKGDRKLKEEAETIKKSKAGLQKEEPVKRSPKKEPLEKVEPEKKPQKPTEEKIETVVPEELVPRVKVTGHIKDVDKKTSKKEEPAKEKAVEKKESEPIVKSEPKVPEIKEVTKEEPVVEPLQPTAPIEKIIPEKETIKVQDESLETPEKEPIQKPEASDLASKKKDIKKEVSDKVVSVKEKNVEKETEPKIEVKKESVPEKKEKIEEPTEKVINTNVEKENKSLVEVENIEKSEPKEEVFRLSGNRIKENIVHKGTIDLSAINGRTRPAKKTEAEKKKDRKEKQQKRIIDRKNQSERPAIPAQGSTTTTPATSAESADKKKKRSRIKKAKVNIDQVSAAPSATPRLRKPTLRKPVQKEASEEDVQKQIKETLARLTQKKPGKNAAKYRKEKRDAVHRQMEIQEKNAQENQVLQLTEFVTANDLANMMSVPVTEVISTCFNLGVMVAINQRLDAETINIVADEFGFQTEYVSADVIEAIDAEEEDAPEDLIGRPPIVTVMGHVDHGKTSLLDNIRNTNVIAGEAGGITQHIGAYHLTLPNDKKITFLDTPGHEAFTAMRARGAKITDVAIIIVAADDNVMPQTKEAINHASAANVPIVFAINKVDKPGANPDKIKEELSQMNYLVEEWGGKYQSQEISAKFGQGVNDLLEKVLLEADLLELKANPNRKAKGSVIESSLDKGRGYVATVLVENGTLKQGDIVLAGTSYGRVKAMFNERDQRIEKAGPAMPVLILGLNGAPQAGDSFHVMENEQAARSIANKRDQLQREQSLRTQKHLTLDDIGRRIAIGNFQELNVIVKGDVDGSVEALADSLMRLSTEKVQVNVIHKGVGQISESDVNLAETSNAIIIGFQVRPSAQARKEAEREGVDIRLYSVIYDAIEEVKAAMEGLLSPEIKEEIVGTAEVQETFKITKVGTVAGCLVKEGKIKRTNKIRLIRDGIVIYTGELGSLKRFKEDVREVNSGYECGLNIKNFNDIQVGDVIESFQEVEVKQTLD